MSTQVLPEPGYLAVVGRSDWTPQRSSGAGDNGTAPCDRCGSSVQSTTGRFYRRLLAAFSADAGWAASVTLIARLAIPGEKLLEGFSPTADYRHRCPC